MNSLPVVLHASLYAALRRLPAERRSRFRRLAERLSTGEWGGGTRVKKLRGYAKPVFEARHDDAWRVVFTLGRLAAEGDGRLVTHVQIWDLVGHDGVDGAAARVNRAAEAEFLDYEEIESDAAAEPPPHPGASFDEIPPHEPGAVSGLLEIMLPPDDFRPRDREEVTGGIRWYVVPEPLLADEGGWQALMDGGAEELELKLTAEQYAVVRAPGPLLLSGTAGSGKTTVAVHRLAAACGVGVARAVYVTYSPWLRDHAQRLFEALCACRGSVSGAAPDFLTMEELYRSLLGAGGAGAGDLVDYPAFSRWYGGALRRGDAALAWEEIRSIVKGACLDPGRTLLERAEYEALGRKRAPLFVGDRTRIYDAALRWQDHLRSTGRIDEIDLCRRALGRSRSAAGWDHVICDEAQDLAEIQVELLLRLHRGPRLEGLFLGGDPQQVINPSGFRWAEVRTAIRERLSGSVRPAPGLTVLTRNFRSVRGLVELANEVLAWKRERTGRSDGDEAEEAAVAGATPIRVDGESEEALAAVVAGFGPRCAIVVGSDETRGRLQSLLETTRIFTVPDAKGLEFDVVVLWGLVSADSTPWIRLLDPQADLREDPACRRALHHLYVAVTRARRHLAVYEPRGAAPVWTASRLAARLDAEPPESLRRLFARSASPADWIREGEYFLERGRHRQAAECFRRAGLARRGAECLARHHEECGEPSLAAPLWLDLGETECAARCFEAAGVWSEARRLWTEQGDVTGERRCAARAAEQTRNWAAAGAAWEALRSWDDAARCWGNAGHRGRQLGALGERAEADGRWAEAARRWEEAEAWERAAAAWRGAERPTEAARAEALAHEAAKRWADAVEAWRAAGEESRALRAAVLAAEAERRWADAAGLWEKLGDVVAAARAWRLAGRPREAKLCESRVDFAAGRFARAAEALEDLGEMAAAADAWRRAHDARQDPARQLPLRLPEAARAAWVEGAKPAKLHAKARGGWRARAAPDARTRGLVCAVSAAEATGRLAEAEAIWRSLGDPDQALRCRVTRLEQDGQTATVAALLEERGLFGAAARAWEGAGHPTGGARCEAKRLEKRRRWDEAASTWAALGDGKQAALCRARSLVGRGQHMAAAAAFEEAGDAASALHMRVMDAQIAGDWERAIALAVEAGRADLADSLRRAAPRASTARAPRAGRAPADAAGDADGGHDALARVVDAVRRNPGIHVNAVASLARLSRERAQTLLRQALAAGDIAKSGATRGTRYWPRPGGR